jgi:DNA-binding CsgD family transcriptional regulator
MPASGAMSDEEQILDLIHRNRIAVWTHDFAMYEKCIVHADYTTRWNASASEGNFVRQGWADIGARIKQLFADDRLLSARNAHDTTIHDLKLRIDGDMAWATFDQHYPFDDQLRPTYFGNTREFRIFERHGGEWRIACWGVMDQSVVSRDAAALHLEGDGTVVWTSAKAKVALENDDDLVIRNGRLRIRDARTDQKLQAAITWAAGLDTSLLAARRALPVVHEAGEGLPTRVWWVIAGNGLIVFLIADASLSERRLEAAAAVFGLSPTQKKLAGLVADGLSLPEIAERMEITANTARTHLERIYEKVGVRTQPALVRVLLSTGSPV